MRRTVFTLAALCAAVFLTACQTNTGHRDHGGTGGGFIESPHEGAHGYGSGSSSSEYPEGDYRNTLSHPGF